MTNGGISKENSFSSWNVMIINDHSFTTRLDRLLTTLKVKAFENIVGKGENAGDQHFLLSPQCFQFYGKNYYFNII